jgi:hypothetical protein
MMNKSKIEKPKLEQKPNSKQKAGATSVRPSIAKPRVGGSTVEKSVLTQNLGDVYKDLNAIKIESSDSFDTLAKKFYAVMTKYGICQGNWSENGRSVASPEWCICWHNFMSTVQSRFNWIYLMSQPPKHLLAYGKKPKVKAR